LNLLPCKIFRETCNAPGQKLHVPEPRPLFCGRPGLRGNPQGEKALFRNIKCLTLLNLLPCKIFRETCQAPGRKLHVGNGYPRKWRQPDRAQRLGRTTPLGRAGRPEEIAEAIFWLLGDASSDTKGANLDVTGGR
jgi:hypothetical protein